MSKELEALENIKHYDSRVGLHESDYDIIEKALKEHEQLKIDYEELNDIHDKLVKHKNKERDDVVNKLKVLEIIKENLVVSYDESENDKPCLVLGFKVDKDTTAIIYHTYDKEKIDLLKEVLL